MDQSTTGSLSAESSVSSLSLTQKQELNTLLAEIARRKVQERLRYFVPTSPPHNDQLGFINSRAKIRAVFGGNRSGKTEVGVADCLMFCLGTHPTRSIDHAPPVNGRYIAPSWEDGIKSVILDKFKSLVPRHLLLRGSFERAWNERARRLEFANGSFIRFFSYEQDLDKMGGKDCDFVYLDEHAPERVFTENLMRLVDRDGYMVLTMTPEAGITWEEDRIINASVGDEGIDFWFFTTYDNPHLSREGIAQVEKMITDPQLREAKLQGRFVSLSGYVYPQFRKEDHVIEGLGSVPDHWWLQFIIDPHHRKDTFMIWVGWDPDGGVAHVVKEAVFSPREGGVRELARLIRAESAGLRVNQWIGDEAMGGEGKNIYGQGSVIVQLQVEGIPVLGTNQASDKAFAAGVNKVRSFLMKEPVSQKPRLYIWDRCVRTIREMQRYQYRRETRVDEELLREHVRNVDDEGPTCIRYALMAQPDLHRGGSVKSALGDCW